MTLLCCTYFNSIKNLIQQFNSARLERQYNALIILLKLPEHDVKRRDDKDHSDTSQRSHAHLIPNKVNTGGHDEEEGEDLILEHEGVLDPLTVHRHQVHDVPYSVLALSRVTHCERLK